MQVLFNDNVVTLSQRRSFCYFFSLFYCMLRTSSCENFINKNYHFFLMTLSSEINLTDLLLILNISQS